MKLLGLDIGNTLIKAHEYPSEKEIVTHRFDRPVDFQNWLEAQEPFEGVVVSSVNWYFENEVIPMLEEIPSILTINTKTKYPFKIEYKTPQTLGSDRLVAAVAAVGEFTDIPLLILDAGTCLTYDLVLPERGFIGGSISPGIEMQYKAMYHFTGSLPNIRRAANFSIIGQSTEECLHSGVQISTVAEFNYRRSLIQEKHPNLHVVVTGGDLPFFVKHFKNEIFARPNLLPIGLKQIYEYNCG